MDCFVNLMIGGNFLLSLVRVHLVISALCVLSLVSHSATAAPLLSVSYEVEGGTFFGPNSSGHVTGGTMSFKSVGYPTPVATPCSGVCVKLTQFSLTGPSGSFRLTLDAVFRHNDHLSPRGQAGDRIGDGFFFSDEVFGSGLVDLTFSYYRRHGNVGFVDGYTFIGRAFRHTYELGNEVRTYVPEPGTGMLLALGLAGLAGSVRLGRKRS